MKVPSVTRKALEELARGRDGRGEVTMHDECQAKQDANEVGRDFIVR